MNKYLAIDIALLPPDKIMDEAIAINKKLIAQYGPKIVLNKHSCLPHITLSQCLIEEKNLVRVVARLKEIAADFGVLELKGKLDKEYNPWLEIAKTKQLQELHNKVMNDFKAFASYDAKKEYFYDSLVRKESLDYVRRFAIESAYDKYYPHLTVGIGRMVDSPKEIGFKAERLAICHLGDYNTCRKILYEESLET